MTSSIELQIISRILTSDNEDEVNTLCEYDASYYALFKEQISFILDHRLKYKNVPDVFTFQAQFPEFTVVKVLEPLSYLVSEICKNKQHIILIEMFNKLKDLGSGDVSEAWQYIANQCDRASQLDSTKPVDIVKDAKERSEQVVEFSKQKRIPTGFNEIDKLMYGGLSTVEELVVVIARTNSGKAQPLWSKVLTPSGWTTMGSLKVGDTVVGKNNDNGKVVKIFPQGVKDYYKVSFDDGTYTHCCDDHLWEVLDATRRIRENKLYGQHEVLTTKQIRENLDKKYSVDVSTAIDLNSQFDESNELDGYLLGVILGDGGLRDGGVVIHSENEDIWNNLIPILAKHNCKRSERRDISIVGERYGANFVRTKLIEYGLMGKKSVEKFIPKQYFTAPVNVRMALLAGLLDTDGYISKDCKQAWEFDTASDQLARDFSELARSLGVKVKIHPKRSSYYTNETGRHEASGVIHIVCRSEFNPFRIPKKADRFVCRTVPHNRSMPKRHCKTITSIEHVGRTECQCILLDNKSHTYITDDYIVTHNTWVCTRMMESAQRHGFPVLYYSPEMQSAFMGTRFDTWRGHFQNSQLFQGKYSEEYLSYLQRLPDEETSAYILEDKNSASGTVNTTVLRTLVQRYGIKLLIVDGLSYMEDTKRADTDYIRYKNICLDLFKLSKQFGCAVVIAMQANRETKDTKDDKGEPFPGIMNAEGSDHPARIATQVFALRQVFDKHVLDIRLEKSRNANNQKPVLSYAWDVNTGNMQYLPGGQDDSVSAVITPAVSSPIVGKIAPDTSIIADDEFEDSEVEF